MHRLILALPFFAYALMLLPLVVLGQDLDSAEQAPVLELSDVQARYPLGHFLEILEDPSAQLSIDQVSSADYAGKFKASHIENPNFGISSSAYWLRFRVKSELTQATDWLLQYGFPNIHHISLYLPGDAGNGYRNIDTGMLHPFSSRDVKHSQFIFQLPAINELPKTIYLRLQSDTNLSLPLQIISVENFLSSNVLSSLLHGLFYGILLVMTGYYAFLWLTLKNINSFFLLLLCASSWIFQFSWDGYASRFLWPDSPWLNDYVIRTFVSLVLLSLLLYTINFLQTVQYAFLHRVLKLSVASWILVILMIPLVDYGLTIKLVLLLALFSFSMILITAVRAMLLGNQSARFFLLGCSFFIFSVLLVSLARLGLAPANIFTQQLSYQLGIIFLVLFLALSLIDNLRRLKQAHEAAKSAALQASMANEKLIMEKNISLEKKIYERTRELIQANNIINESPAVAFLWINTENWPVEFVSRNIIELSGYSSSDFINGRLTYRDLIYPEDYARVKQEVLDYSDAEDFNHQSYRIVCKTGAIKWLDDHTTILRDDKGQITHYQGIVIDVTERELAKQELLKKQLSLDFLAHHDTLTNLPNRLMFMHRMQQAILTAQRFEQQLALLFIDLNNFKPINDTYGHDTGDAVLKIIAQQLQKNIREKDIVARLGGDEFVILMEQLSDPQEAAVMAEKIIRAQQQPLQINAQSLNITLSIGISLFPQDGDDMHTLIKHGDTAMYRCKESSANAYQFYKPPNSASIDKTTYPI